MTRCLEAAVLHLVSLALSFSLESVPGALRIMSVATMVIIARNVPARPKATAIVSLESTRRR